MYNSALISREQIQVLHSQLAAVTVSGGVVSHADSSIRQQKSSEDHDYVNDSEVATDTKSAHDYINQDIIDSVLTDNQGKQSENDEMDLFLPLSSDASGCSAAGPTSSSGLQVASSTGYSSQGNPCVRNSR